MRFTAQLRRRSVDLFPSPMKIAMLRRVRRELRSRDGTLLDVGCAATKYAHLFGGFRYIGLDPDRGLLRSGVEVESSLGRHVVVICGRAESLPLANRSMDVVVSTHALVYFSDRALRSALVAMQQVLRNGSMLLIHIEKTQLDLALSVLKNVKIEVVEVHSEISRRFESYWHDKVGRRGIAMLWQILGFSAAFVFSFVETRLPGRTDVLLVGNVREYAK